MTKCTRRPRMQMRCTWWHDMKCMSWTKCKTKDKNPTTEGISYHIAKNGKSRSYKYGKLHVGCYTGAAADRRRWVVSRRAGRRSAGRGQRGAAVWPVVAGSSGGLGWRWTATWGVASALASTAATAFLLLVRSVSIIKFSFDNKIQFQQLSSISAVKFSFDG